MDVCAQKAISFKAGNMTLKAPADTFSEDEQKKRDHNGRIAWGIALLVLCLALVWFNFLDPAVKKTAQAGAVKPASSAESAAPTGPSESAESTAPAESADPAESAAPAESTESAESALPAAAGTVERTIGSEVGQQLADFSITCLDGSTFTLSENRGKVVFINLWATYCTPCVKELPHFDAFYREHMDDIAVLAVHSSIVTDEPDEYLSDKGYAITFALDTDDDYVWQIVNGASTLPQTIVLDRNGVVVYNQKGSVTPEILAALYEQASAIK
jgi:thiol-disulfide isomerase/thioredoxin